jgi:hypothetical protein
MRTPSPAETGADWGDYMAAAASRRAVSPRDPGLFAVGAGGLTGIIVSLFINAWPAFQKFGLNFIGASGWDVVNEEEFGAAIAIDGHAGKRRVSL